MKRLILLMLFPVLAYGQLSKPPSTASAADMVARDSITAHRINLDTLFSGRVRGSGTINYFPYWSSASGLANSNLKASGNHLILISDDDRAAKLYIIDGTPGDSTFVGMDNDGNLVFKDEFNNEVTLSALLAGGGAGDTTFVWSIYGSGTFATDTLYLQGMAPLVFARIGNLFTAFIDTTTSGTGLMTKYQGSLKEGTITAGTSSDYWRGDKTWQPFASNVRSQVSGKAGEISYNSSTGVISLVAIDTVGTITSGIWRGTAIDTLRGGTGGTTRAGGLNNLLPSQVTHSGKYLYTDGANASWQAGGAGSGTVTSVGLSLPAIFSVSGSPVTTSGTLTGSLTTQTANLVWAGPSSGSPAAPTFRALTLADMQTAWWDSLGDKFVNTTGLGAGDALVYDGTEWDAVASVAVNVSANKLAQMNATGDTLGNANVRLDSTSNGSLVYTKNDSVIAAATVGTGLSFSGGALSPDTTRLQSRREVILLGAITIDSSAQSTSGRYPLYFNLTDTVVVTSLMVVGTTTADLTVDVRFDTSASATGTGINSSAYTCNSNTYGNEDTAFDAATIPARRHVWVELDAITTKPWRLSVTLSGYRK